MADAGDVFGRTAELHDGDGFGNEFGRHRADDVHTQYFIGFGVGQNLHEARGVTQRPCTAVGHEGEAAGLVLDAVVLELLLVATHPRDFGRRVNDRGNGGEIDVAVLAADAFGHCNTLFFGLVRQHRATHHVTHRPDIGQIRAALVVNGNEAALVELEPDRFGIEPLHVGHTSDRHDELVDSQFLFSARRISVVDGNALGARLGFGDFDAGVNLETLLGEGLERFLGDLLVGHGQELGHCFEHGDFGPQAAPYAAQFQPNDTGTDHAQFLGHRRNAQRTVVRQHGGLVEFQARQLTRGGTRCNDHVLGNQFFFSLAGHLDAPAAVDLTRERTHAMKERDLVLLEQVKNAVVVLLDDRILAADEGLKLEIDALHLDAVLGKVVIDLLVVFR